MSVLTSHKLFIVLANGLLTRNHTHPPTHSLTCTVWRSLEDLIQSSTRHSFPASIRYKTNI